MNGTSAGADNLGLIYSGVPLVDPKTGVISRPWWQFFNSLYSRVGGPNAPSNNELEAMINVNSPISVIDDIAQDDPFILPIVPPVPVTPSTLGQPTLAINENEQEDIASIALSMNNINAQDAQTLQNATWASPLSIGSTTANAGTFTTLSASSTVSGSGFSTYLASPPAIGGTSPAAGTFTTLTATSGVIMPYYPDGILGSTSGASVSTGSIGEIVSNSAAAVSITTATPTSIASISLGAGNWLIFGSITFNFGAGTTATLLASMLNSGASIPSKPYYSIDQTAKTNETSLIAPSRVEMRNASFTYDIVAYTNFAGGTLSGDGYIVAIRLP
jgi:hypothetical protein